MTTRSLAVRLLALSVLLPASFSAPAFAAAGSMAFWQAWVYCGEWIAVTTAMGVYFLRHDRALLERRFKAGERARTQQVLQTFVGLSFFSVFVMAGLDHRWGWTHVPWGFALAADLLIGLGFFLVFLVFRENSFASATIEIDPKQRVVSTGPYRIVRHPMYLAALLVFGATPIALASYAAALLVAPFLLVVVLRLLDEERFLTKNLQGYTDYMQRSRYHLVPYLW